MPPKKKSTKKTGNTAPVLPAHFMTNLWISNDLAEIIPINEMPELNMETRRLDGILAEQVDWLRHQRDLCSNIGQQHGIRVPIPKNSYFRQLEHYSMAEVKEENVDHEMDPELTDEAASSRREGSKYPEESTAPVATPRSRPPLRQSQIKPEPISPEADSQPAMAFPIPNPRTLPLPREDDIKKEEPALSPRKKAEVSRSRPVAKTPLRVPRHHRIAQNQPEKKEDVTTFETKLEQAARRRREQQQQKVEKAKKEHEANERRVKENLEKKKQEDQKKAEERRQQELRADELRKQNAARSPSRSRYIISAATTPNKNKSPARKVVPTPRLISRVKLFDDPPNSIRTPERPHSKQPRMEQLLSAVRSSPAHPSPIRQVVRKVPSQTRKTPKVSGEENPSEHDALDAQFKEEQLRLMMELDGQASFDREEARIAEEAEQQRREETERALVLEEARRRVEEERRREEQERCRKEKERRLEAERLRLEEQERLRLEEEKRQRLEEEKRRRAEEERIEQEASLVREAMSTTFDISMREDSTEDGTSDVDAYEMTQEKIFIPSTAENYHIEDLDSGDETDDECAPRKKVPEWAQWENLYKTATLQYRDRNVDYDEMFGSMDNPHSQPIFNSAKTKRRPRGSSAQWNSPASNPTKGKSRFLGY